jgi:cell division protein FtsN
MLRTPPGVDVWTVQAGAFGEPSAAARRAAEVRPLAGALPVEVASRDGLYKVLVGRFATQEEAESARRELSSRGLASAWVTRAGR